MYLTICASFGLMSILNLTLNLPICLRRAGRNERNPDHTNSILVLIFELIVHEFLEFLLDTGK